MNVFLIRIIILLIMAVLSRTSRLLLLLPGTYGPEGMWFFTDEAKQHPVYRDTSKACTSYSDFITVLIVSTLLLAIISFFFMEQQAGLRAGNAVLTGIVGVLICIYVVWTVKLRHKVKEMLVRRQCELSQDGTEENAPDELPRSYFQVSKKISLGVAGVWALYLFTFAMMVIAVIRPR